MGVLPCLFRSLNFAKADILEVVLGIFSATSMRNLVSSLLCYLHEMKFIKRAWDPGHVKVKYAKVEFCECSFLPLYLVYENSELKYGMHDSSNSLSSL